MTANEQAKLFEVLIDGVANFTSPGYTNEEKGLILTKAQETYLYTPYSKPDPSLHFEVNEKRRKDLGELKSYAELSPSSNQIGIHTNGVFYDLPLNFLWTMSEEVIISSDDECLNGTSPLVVPITEDQYGANKNNPFKKPSPDKIWRMDFSRVTAGDGEIKRHELITDGTYTISKYKVWYTRRPRAIVPFDASGSDTSTAALQNCELDESAHTDIVDIAVRIATSTTNPQEYQIKVNEENLN